MGIIDCPACGKPRLFSRVIGWGDNGTIVSKFRPAFRLVLVESALLEDIYQRIEKALGVSIREIVFEAERAASIATIDSLFPDWIVKWLLRNRVAMHPTSWGMQELARIAGLGDVHTVFYHVYRGAMSRVRNEYNRELFAAMVVGAFERVEGVVYDHAWIEMGEELFLFINPAKGKPEIAARMKPRLVTPSARAARNWTSVPTAVSRAPLPTCAGIPPAVITDERRGVRKTFRGLLRLLHGLPRAHRRVGEDTCPSLSQPRANIPVALSRRLGILTAGKKNARTSTPNSSISCPSTARAIPCRATWRRMSWRSPSRTPIARTYWPANCWPSTRRSSHAPAPSISRRGPEGEDNHRPLSVPVSRHPAGRVPSPAEPPPPRPCLLPVHGRLGFP